MLRSVTSTAIRRCRASTSLSGGTSACGGGATTSSSAGRQWALVAQQAERSSCRPFSASVSDGDGAGDANASMYASVDHGSAYEEALAGRHGEQLRLAYDEGKGKDDPPYDPFALFLPDEDELNDNLDAEENDRGQDGADETAAASLDEPLEDLEQVSDDEEEYSDDEEEDDQSPEYTNQGFRDRPKSQLAALKSGLPAGGLFAVLSLPGTQQKVTVDDVIVTNKLKPADKWAVGNTITLKDDDVLLVGSTHFTLVGLPGVSGVEVDVLVEENTRDARVLIFKKRKRKHSRRLNGFRRDVTLLRVMDIRLPEKYSNAEYKETLA
mmetsp:Transcript_6453/g.18020  ORF Transcript_6453/g.18020 Transcript_6453/m.18020 type:complete len:324 (-) Transcript_6453:664-1635(-)